MNDPLRSLALAATAPAADVTRDTADAATQAATATVETVSFAEALMSIVLPLALVIGALVVTLWLIRRHGKFGSGTALLKVIQILPVGPREKIVVLADGERRFAIGVTPHTITPLTEIRQSVAGTGDADAAGVGGGSAHAASKSGVPRDGFDR